MPNPFLPGHNRDHGLQNDEKQEHASTSLSGWEGIENHVMKHDTGEMKDYADDIDTLLVFAGLFSSILTGFVVATYPSLQADGSDTTNQLLALSLSIQLKTTPTTIPDSMSTTISSLVDSPPFSASAANRSINTLLFLSLIFSLAAALLGIFAKQWIREYLKWNSPLAAPRENILVRQMRFEAWSECNVSAIISSIPIILELAMILFLGGITVLLWTLDDVVAIVVTVAVALFLVIICAFTILPIFIRRCPYRSPTAWAVIVSTTWIHNLFSFPVAVVRWCALMCYTAYRQDSDWPSWWWVKSKPPRSWRDIDLRSLLETEVRRGPWWARRRDITAAAESELRLEDQDLKKTFGVEIDSADPAQYRGNQLLQYITETSILGHALTWVKVSSQNTQVSRYIETAAVTIRPKVQPETMDIRGLCRIIAVSSWCAMASIEDTTLQPIFALLPKSSGKPTTLASAERANAIAGCVQTMAPTYAWALHSKVRLLKSRRLMTRLSAMLRDAQDFTTGTPQEEVFWLIAHLNFKYLVETTLEHDYGSLDLARLIQFSALLLVVNFNALSSNLDIDTHRTPLCRQFLDRVNAANEHPRDHSYAFFLMASMLSKVVVNVDTMMLEARSGVTGREDYEGLILHFSDMHFKDTDDNHLQIFIHSAINWLWHAWVDNDNDNKAGQLPVLQVFEKMVHVAQAILRRGQRTCYYGQTDATWLFAIRAGVMGTDKVYFYPPLRQLLHILERSYMARILVGDQSDIRKSLHILLERTHGGISRCEASDCRWISHQCNGSGEDHYGACPLLDRANAANVGMISPPSPGPNTVSRRLISSMPAGAEAEGSGAQPGSLSPGNSSVEAAGDAPHGRAEWVVARVPAELSSASALDVQAMDVPNKILAEHHHPSASPDHAIAPDSPQRELYHGKFEAASTTLGTLRGFVPRQSPSGASNAPGTVNAGDIGRGAVRVEGSTADTSDPTSRPDGHPGEPEPVIPGFAVSEPSSPHEFASESGEADATTVAVGRSPDDSAFPAVVDTDGALQHLSLSRLGDMPEPSTFAESDAAERSPTAPGPNVTASCAGSPPVRDSAQLFLAADEREASSGLSFETENLGRIAVWDGERDEHAEKCDDLEEGGDGGRGSAGVGGGAGTHF